MNGEPGWHRSVLDHQGLVDGRIATDTEVENLHRSARELEAQEVAGDLSVEDDRAQGDRIELEDLLPVSHERFPLSRGKCRHLVRGRDHVVGELGGGDIDIAPDEDAVELGIPDEDEADYAPTSIVTPNYEDTEVVPDLAQVQMTMSSSRNGNPSQRSESISALCSSRDFFG